MARRILVVEDDLLNRMFYSAVLESGGFIAETVADGDLAIDAVRKFAPDLIVMDIQLPNISGLELIEILQAALPFGRHGDGRDVLADAAGVALAFAVAWAVRRGLGSRA